MPWAVRRSIRRMRSTALPASLVVVSGVDACRARRSDREQIEAQPLDRDDIADVRFVEQVAAPDAEFQVLVGRRPADAGVDERALRIGQALDVTRVVQDL